MADARDNDIRAHLGLQRFIQFLFGSSGCVVSGMNNFEFKSNANEALITETEQVGGPQILPFQQHTQFFVGGHQISNAQDSVGGRWDSVGGRQISSAQQSVGGRTKMPTLPEVSAVPACRGSRASGSVGISVGSKRCRSEDGDFEHHTRVRGGVTYVSAVRRTSGAIIAQNRTDEMHTLPSGRQRTCLVDAVFNAALTLDPKSKMSLKRLRTAAMPKLGNVLEASPESLRAALAAQNAPLKLKESTTGFNKKGGLMLNILNASPGAYVVTARVTIRMTIRSSTGLKKEEQTNRHAVCVSTLSEEHCPYGKLIDNRSNMKPAYIEDGDRLNKKTAKNAFKELFKQRVGHDDFCVELAEIFELVPL